VTKVLKAGGAAGQDLLTRIDLQQKGKFHSQGVSSYEPLTSSSTRSYRRSPYFRSRGSPRHARAR
jgi:hypothetical protein